MTCPFCNDDDFDAVGLKIHLTAGHCTAFNDVREAVKCPNCHGTDTIKIHNPEVYEFSHRCMACGGFNA